MDELRQILFRKTANMADEAARRSGESSVIERFSALYSVIVEVDLEDDYYDWKRANGYMN